MTLEVSHRCDTCGAPLVDGLHMTRELDGACFELMRRERYAANLALCSLYNATCWPGPRPSHVPLRHAETVLELRMARQMGKADRYRQQLDALPEYLRGNG